MTVEPTASRPERHRSVPVLSEHDLGHYPEFAEFFTRTFDLRADPLRPPGLLRVGERIYELVFVGRSGRPFPAAVEINALVPGLEPLHGDVEADLWDILRWLLDGVGGEWTAEDLDLTGRIYRLLPPPRD